MATDVERLMIRLEASASKFERDMERARDKAAKTTRDIEKSFEGLNAGITRAVKPLGAALVAALSLDQIRKAADTYTNAINQLKVAGTSTADLPRLFDQLFASAQRNAVPIEALAQLYGRVSQAQDSLKVSSGDVLQITDIVAQALRVSGASAESASGALLQLSQALSGGTVQAEEWNSLLDGMYPLLQAAASGIKEAGGDVAALTRLVKDGEVSSKALFEGIRAGSGVLKDKLANSTLTVGQAMTKMSNEFVRAVGEFDKMVGVTPALAGALDTIAGSMTGIARTAADATNTVLGLMKAIAGLPAASASLANAAGAAAAGKNYTPLDRETVSNLRQELAGLEKQRDDIVARSRNADARDMLIAPLNSRISDLQNRLAAGPQFTPDMASAEMRAEAAREAARGGAWKNVAPNGGVKPISLADYPANAAKDGEGGASKARKISEYERELQQLQKKTELLRAEAAVMEQGNAAVERARIVRELELAAKKSGVAESEAVKAAIQKEADAHMAVKKVIEEKTQAMEAMRELQQFIGSSMASFFSDVISGGKNASDALMNLTKRLADAALQAALLGSGPLASLFGTAPKAGASNAVGGIVGALFSGFSKSGGAAAGAVGMPLNILPKFAEGTNFVPRDMIAQIHKGEMIVPAFDAAKIRNGASSRPASNVINISVVGATGNAEVERMVARGVAAGVRQSVAGEQERFRQYELRVA